jgi:hypothetical protein
VRALVEEFVHAWRTGNYEYACRLETARQQRALAAARNSTCGDALAHARWETGDAALARYEREAASLKVTVVGDTAVSTNSETLGGAHFSYVGGRWRIGSRARRRDRPAGDELGSPSDA